MSELDSSLSLPAAAAALSAEDRAGLVNALKDKLHDLAEQHVDVMESLPPRVRNRVEALKNIQGKHDELEAKFLEERAVLEAKYQNLYQPFYKKRSEIVNGVAEVEGVTDGGNEAKGVPDFWLTAMKSNEILAAEISENDVEALKFLKDIKWSKLDDPKGFKLEFFFDTNPFFKNSVLTKTYHMIDEDEPILEKAIGTVIEWHPAKCLTQKVLKKKPKKGMPKNAKITVKIEKCESFFNFFNPPEVPEDEDAIDDDAAEELQNLMEQDYDIGSTIRDKIIPHAVSWFTGEAAEDDGVIISDDDEDDEDEDEDEDEEEDEDDDEDEDEEEEEVAVKGRKKKIGGGQAGEEGQAECKQQ